MLSRCLVYCRDLKFSYYGMNGGSCWCGNRRVDRWRTEESLCDRACPGKPVDAMCGGTALFNVYLIKTMPSKFKLGN